MFNKTILSIFLIFSLAFKANAQDLHLIYNTDNNAKKKGDLDTILKKQKDGTTATLSTPDLPDDIPFYIIPLKKLARSISKRSNDTTELRIIGNLIDSIRLNYSLDFLSSVRYGIRPFTVFDLGMYDIDTINKYLYSQSSLGAFQSAGFQYFGNSNSYITTEFLSYFFGPVRMGVAGSFKATGDTSTNNKINTSLQKVLSNGGAMDLNFSMPIMFCRNRYEQVHFGIFAQSNFQLNPSLNGETNTSTNLLFNNQSGFVIHFDVASNKDAQANQVARIFVDIPLYYVCGSPNTYNQLVLTDFSVMQVKLGLVITDLMSFSITGQALSTSTKVQSLPWLFSINFSPSQLAQSSN